MSFQDRQLLHYAVFALFRYTGHNKYTVESLTAAWCTDRDRQIDSMDDFTANPDSLDGDFKALLAMRRHRKSQISEQEEKVYDLL